MHTPLRLAALATMLAAALVGSTGCAPDDDVDPTSASALRRAEPLAFGCTYVREDYSSYGTASSTKRTPACTTGLRCEELETPDSDHAYVGGGSYFGVTLLEDRSDFIGTCDDPQPISCEYLEETGNACDACLAKSCCLYTFLCDQDPNCHAIIECIDGCKDDEACQTRCVTNGERTASNHLVEAASCLGRMCSDACGG